MRENAETLGSVPLFMGFSKKHLQRLAAETDELHFDKRETVVEEGMLGETLFVVLSGQRQGHAGQQAGGRGPARRLLR